MKESADTDEYEEAPYAYTADEEAAGTGAEDSMSSQQVLHELPPISIGDIVAQLPPEDADADMLDDEESVLTGYVGSSAPSCTPSSAQSIDSTLFPYSLASTPGSQPNYSPPGYNTGSQPEALRHDGGSRVEIDGENTDGPSLSQDGFTIEKTERAPEMPQQLPVFLNPFSGALTSVPANGQWPTRLYTPPPQPRRSLNWTLLRT
ncbi:hypothetical protein PF005_g25275 [Phytophthora fragariae]|uniref:Uncharacterized protein n=1 Tax=Phytophthora fragariae TaxID=53985 RepID=A0A6A4BFV9_9STRA|nr:hypothetical protein PF003_g12990 [Phytophthora fragariae]KAE8923754.1 hypothetical protein PF009_g26002 [Phytophthora fragariae]KAE9067250.1 hypothetical protein PF010_g27538 [Phytophthora fragariae]KAE9074608.1 hypothetical protein PF007_g25339 [Phytophthora fragariae]KAE9078941.1 hypothetical protein PF006_g27615 [Phytophthora fragariae]